MSISLIVATLPSGAIAYKGKLPWSPGTQKGDMRHFTQTTTGHTVVMGRKTWDTIPTKFRPLPNRQNLILSHTLPYGFLSKERNACVLRTFEGILKMSKREKIFIIGGEEIYNMFLQYADEILITRVHIKLWGGSDKRRDFVYFPELDRSVWTIDHSFTRFEDGGPDQENKWPMSFFRYVRE